MTAIYIKKAIIISMLFDSFKALKRLLNNFLTFLKCLIILYILKVYKAFEAPYNVLSFNEKASKFELLMTKIWINDKIKVIKSNIFIDYWK